MHWQISINSEVLYDIPCTGPGNVEPLVDAFGSRALYDVDVGLHRVKIKHPLNPDTIIFAHLIYGDEQ